MTPAARTLKGAMSAWGLTAWVSGAFALLAGLAMLAGFFQHYASAPLTDPAMRQLKDKLRLESANEPLKQQIRDRDLAIRKLYFRNLSRLHSGAWLLIIGSAVFVVAVTQARRGRPPLLPAKASPDAAEEARRAAGFARWAVAGAGTGFGVLLFVLSATVSAYVPVGKPATGSEAGQDAPTAAPDCASPEELNRNWPGFRGPGGNGVLASGSAPLNWEARSGAGVAWKIPVPAQGFNSPIIWDERIFFSGGDAMKREVFCLDLKTGQTLWRVALANVPGTPAQTPEIPESAGFCASTMATDGRRVYVMFANGDVGAFTLEGRQVWAKGFGALKNPYGFAISLATWRDRLIIQLDQGESEDNLSRLYALDGRTGKVLWQRPRKAGASWASPIVIEAAGKTLIITLAVPCVVAYSAEDGAELWRVDCLNGEVTPSPVFAAGLVLVASPTEKIVAIRPDGQGDVTKTHIAWGSEDNIPDVTSPVSDGALVFTATTGGMVTCRDVKDGRKLWEHDFETEFHASPALADKRLYLFSQKGQAFVVEAGREFKEVFRTEMPDAFHASPAFAPNTIVLRGLTNVWCLGAQPGTKQATHLTPESQAK